MDATVRKWPQSGKMQGSWSRSISLYSFISRKSTQTDFTSSVAQTWQNFEVGQTSPQRDGPVIISNEMRAQITGITYTDDRSLVSSRISKSKAPSYREQHMGPYTWSEHI